MVFTPAVAGTFPIPSHRGRGRSPASLPRGTPRPTGSYAPGRAPATVLLQLGAELLLMLLDPRLWLELLGMAADPDSDSTRFERSGR